MNPDAELLQRYAHRQTAEDFAELVQRHLAFVYAAALRQLNGSAHRAEDVTQLVFIELSRQARSLAHRTEIAGWLYTTTHHVAAKLKRSEQRRQIREQEAHIMEADSAPAATAIEWEQLRPVLDEAMNELNASDRAVILARFFQARPFADVGRPLGLSADAARMRVERALEKLREQLSRRRITSTTSALALILAAQPAVAVPAHLAATVTAAAIAAGAGSGAGFWMTIFTMNKLHFGMAGVVAVAGTIGFALQAQDNARLRVEVASLRQENADLAPRRSENLRLARAAAEVVALRGDDAELARLSGEAATLKDRLQQVERAEQAQAASAKAQALANLDRTPVPKWRIRPSYPTELRAGGLGGEVLIEFVVDANGEVRDVRSLGAAVGGAVPQEPSGAHVRLESFLVAAAPLGSGRSPDTGLAAAQVARLLEDAAVEAVRQWKFDAGRKAGRAATTRMTVPIVFAVTD